MSEPSERAREIAGMCECRDCVSGCRDCITSRAKAIEAYAAGGAWQSWMRSTRSQEYGVE
jgi:hypothetical protein